MSSAADDSSAYPVLGDEEVAILRRYGTVHRTTAGQVLSAADDTYDLIVVLSGCVEVGFPEGISGTELTTRATIQAQKFGALLASPCRVDRLTVSGGKFSVLLTDGTVLSARTVVAATGAVYRRLPLAGWRRLEGAGIYYAATDLEAGLCAGTPVVVLGGGNSAGQAALYLARRCPRVTIVSRDDSFAASMSQYLIERVAASPRIEVAMSTIIQAVDGGEHLEAVTLRNTVTGRTRRLSGVGLFCFIGALPASSWLPEDVARDDDGFVLTDIAVPHGVGRPRLPYETSVGCSPLATSAKGR